MSSHPDFETPQYTRFLSTTLRAPQYDGLEFDRRYQPAETDEYAYDVITEFYGDLFSGARFVREQYNPEADPAHYLHFAMSANNQGKMASYLLQRATVPMIVTTREKRAARVAKWYHNNPYDQTLPIPVILNAPTRVCDEELAVSCALQLMMQPHIFQDDENLTALMQILPADVLELMSLRENLLGLIRAKHHLPHILSPHDGHPFKQAEEVEARISEVLSNI